MKNSKSALHENANFRSIIQSALVMVFTRGGVFSCILISSHIANKADFGIFTSIYWASTSLGQVVGYYLISSSAAMHTRDEPKKFYNSQYIKNVIDHSGKSICVFFALYLALFFIDPQNIFENRYNSFEAAIIMMWSAAVSLELMAIYLANSLNLLNFMLYASLMQIILLSISPFFYIILGDHWMAIVVIASFVSGLGFLIAALKGAPESSCPTDMYRKITQSPTYGAMNILTVLMGSFLIIIFTQSFAANGSQGISSIAEITVALQIVSALSFIPQILNNEMVRRIHQADGKASKLKILIDICGAITIFTFAVSIPFLIFSENILNIYGISVADPDLISILSILTILFQALSLTISTYLMIHMSAFAIFSSTVVAFCCSVSFFFYELTESASHILLCLVLFHCVRSAGLAAHLLHKSGKVFRFSLARR